LHRTIPPYFDGQNRFWFVKAFKGIPAMFLSHFFRFLRQWRAYGNSLQELSRLGDRELADIGISRSDIPRIAWENAERAS
jgi:uncharacterized protein YjiS (DUF1127 family)